MVQVLFGLLMNRDELYLIICELDIIMSIEFPQKPVFFLRPVWATWVKRYYYWRQGQEHHFTWTMQCWCIRYDGHLAFRLASWSSQVVHHPGIISGREIVSLGNDMMSIRQRQRVWASRRDRRLMVWGHKLKWRQATISSQIEMKVTNSMNPNFVPRFWMDILNFPVCNIWFLLDSMEDIM
jgi:hypothetical protein